MKKLLGLFMTCVVVSSAVGQVDTTFIYKTGLPYGTLDIRVAKSSTRYYYLQENKTFSFRESSPGVRTETYQDMTSWDSSPYTQGNLREKNGSADAFVMNYRLLFPQGYNATIPDGYPMIVMIHGGGERGNCWDAGCYWADKLWKPQTNSPAAPTTSNHQLLNNDHNLLHGGLAHLEARNRAGSKLPDDPWLLPRAFPGFVLFPQNLNGWDANQAQDVIRIIRLLSKKYKIDPNRIYVHGLSNGGFGTYEVIKRAPWLFSCALPMSAISDASVTNATYSSVLNDISHIPFWIFQGAKDTNPVPSRTRTYIKKFTDIGMNVRYTEYTNLGHGVWNDAYAEPDFFLWMRSKNKANIHVFGNVPAICNTTGQGVRMSLARGFFAYQWEYNGVIIPEAQSSNFTATMPGVYRARFSRVPNPTEQQWNRWSDPVTVSESNPEKPQVNQIGSVVLKDLNNLNDARLVSAKENLHYYWYKDGVLLDLPGNQDDTTRHPIFKQGTCDPYCRGNGVYTLVVAGSDNCPSPPSDPKHVYFNNQAPVSVNAPLSFSGSATSSSASSLQWSDASDNESGFEIWRRLKRGTTYSKWSLATITEANATSFNDSRLEPSATYEYKIRAVGNSGRSNYTPSASNQFLTIITHKDSNPPPSPTNVVATATGIRQITMTWDAVSDDTGIREYLILYGDDTVSAAGNLTSLILNELELNTTYNFEMQAVDLGGNVSDRSNSTSANTFVKGLYYEHTTGGWSDLDQIDWNFAERKGTVPTFTLSRRTQEDYFNFEFEGFLYINTAGTYQFRTTSDDGSRMILNGVVVVENDGLHGNITVTSSNHVLQNGPQHIVVRYFEYGGGQTLTVQYRGPDTGNTWLTIPDYALKSGDMETTSARMASTSSEHEGMLTPEMISAYPNPVTPDQELSLAITTETDEPVEVTLVNVLGEQYYSAQHRANDLEAGVSLPVRRKLTKGVYIMSIRQRHHVIRKTIIVKE